MATVTNRSEFTRLVERFEVACAYIRERDVLRLRVTYGLPTSGDVSHRIRQLERRYDELAPRPKVSAIRYPEWVR